VFLVEWMDFAHEENMWETFDTRAESNLKLLEDYYKKNPIVEEDRRFTSGKKRKILQK